MKNFLFLLLITHCSLLIVEAQTQFQRAIGGGNVDLGFSIVRTTDGGFAVAGQTNSFGAGDYDFYIVKLNSGGTLQWSRTIGGTGYDVAYCIIQTTDGGYAVAGQTGSFGTGGDFYIVKLDSSGTLQWSKTIGGTGGDVAYCIIQTTDGGLAVAGYTNSFGAGNLDMYIVKLDGSGTLQWSKTIGGTLTDAAVSIVQTTDGGYAVAGYTNSIGPPYYDLYIVKLNSSGTLQWSKTTIGGGTGTDVATSIVRTTDGGFAVAGYTNSFGPSSDMYIVKLDSSGTLQWTRTVGGTGYDRAGTTGSIIQTSDGGYAVAGWTDSFGAGIYDMYIVKLDGSATLQWSKTVGGTGYDDGYSIIQTTDGGYVAAGSYSFGAGNSDFYIVKLDGSGNTCGNTTTPPSISGSGGVLASQTSTVTSPTSIVTTPAPTVSSGGAVTSICTMIGVNGQQGEIPKEYILEQNYPNPFNPKTIINYELPITNYVLIKVYDVLGNEVSTLVNEKQNAGSYEVEFDGSNFASGVYYYKLTSDGFAETKKMLLTK